MRPHPLPRFRGRRSQRGLSLLFALMALVILAFGAVALTRSVDTGTLVMGNLAMKEDTLLAGASATEQAVAWLSSNTGGTKLDANDAAHGYYASSIDKLDPTGNHSTETNKLSLVNWDGSCNGADKATYETCDVLPFTGTAVNGNKVQWVITRLCDKVGTPSASNLCVRPAASSTSTASDRGALNQRGRPSGGIASPFYRVVVRVEGPRNTISYTESLLHF
jgi:Tfp pilus assembly protein PilX